MVMWKLCKLEFNLVWDATLTVYVIFSEVSKDKPTLSLWEAVCKSITCSMFLPFSLFHTHTYTHLLRKSPKSARLGCPTSNTHHDDISKYLNKNFDGQRREEFIEHTETVATISSSSKQSINSGHFQASFLFWERTSLTLTNRSGSAIKNNKQLPARRKTNNIRALSYTAVFWLTMIKYDAVSCTDILACN